MQKDVTQGKSYCLTVYSVPCKVTAIGKNNIEYTLLNVSETGQYLFIAPTWKVNISQDDASIVETFNLAGTGKVDGSGSGFDPASDQTISGAWSFTNTAGLVLGNEVPLVLGQGDDAVKIHGDGNGAAVIEGTNASHMDVAIPVKFQDPTTFDEVISFVAASGEKMKCILFGKESGPTRAILYEESNGFLSITDPNNVNSKSMTFDGAGDLWVYRNENHNGVATFNTQTRMHGTIDVGGVLTFRKTPNANAGINIPLAVGAPTDTSAVNRLHAAGLAGVTDIFSQHAYLNTGSITATGTAATTAFIPGQYAQVRVPAGTHSTIVSPFTGPNGQHNYSNFAGFSIPWRILGAGKITIGIGRGSKTTRSDLTLDSYSVIPGNNLAHNSGEILDITFDNIRDTQRNGYTVRVREIYALTAADGWKVKTTTSFIPASHNEPIPSIVNKIIYHQRTQYKFESEYISYGSLYLLTGGGQTVQLHKIAAVRGVNAFETGVGISSIVTDLPGNASGDVYMQVGSAVRTLYQPGNINPVYYALEALARNDIESEETADFVDINIPL